MPSRSLELSRLEAKANLQNGSGVIYVYRGACTEVGNKPKADSRTFPSRLAGGSTVTGTQGLATALSYIYVCGYVLLVAAFADETRCSGILRFRVSLLLMQPRESDIRTSRGCFNYIYRGMDILYNCVRDYMFGVRKREILEMHDR